MLSTCPPAEAAALARHLVEQRLAACVNIVENAHSVYRWRGEVTTDREALLIIKTRQDLFPALEAAVRQIHSYEVPELIALPITAGAASYLSWWDEALPPLGS